MSLCELQETTEAGLGKQKVQLNRGEIKMNVEEVRERAGSTTNPQDTKRISGLHEKSTTELLKTQICRSCGQEDIHM